MCASVCVCGRGEKERDRGLTEEGITLSLALFKRKAKPISYNLTVGPPVLHDIRALRAVFTLHKYYIHNSGIKLWQQASRQRLFQGEVQDSRLIMTSL